MLTADRIDMPSVTEWEAGEGPDFVVCFGNGYTAHVPREAFAPLMRAIEAKLPWFHLSNPNGSVTDTAIDAGATLTDTTTQQCLLGVLSGLSFPSAPDKTTVTYPMEFAPGE